MPSLQGKLPATRIALDGVPCTHYSRVRETDNFDGGHLKVHGADRAEGRKSYYTR